MGQEKKAMGISDDWGQCVVAITKYMGRGKCPKLPWEQCWWEHVPDWSHLPR